MTEAKRGGARPNSGRKTEVQAKMKTVALSLDDRTVEMLQVVGGGNASRGARDAARLAYDRYQNTTQRR